MFHQTESKTQGKTVRRGPARPSIFTEIKARLSVEAMLDAAGVEVTESGSARLISCLWHPGDDTPSCQVHDDGLWCHGCRTQHDVIDLYVALAAREGTSPRDARAKLRWLHRKGLLPAPSPWRASKEPKSFPGAWELDQFLRRCSPIIGADPIQGSAQALLRGKNIDPQAVEALRLARVWTPSGYEPPWWRYPCAWIICPLVDGRGEIVSVGGRAIAASEKRWPAGCRLQGTCFADQLGRQVLATRRADGIQRILVTEGQTDFLWAASRAHEAPGTAVLGIHMGSGYVFEPYWPVVPTIIATDNDLNGAGDRYANEIAEHLRPKGVPVLRYRPATKDLCATNPTLAEVLGGAR